MRCDSNSMSYTLFDTHIHGPLLREDAIPLWFRSGASDDLTSWLDLAEFKPDRTVRALYVYVSIEEPEYSGEHRTICRAYRPDTWIADDFNPGIFQYCINGCSIPTRVSVTRILNYNP